MRRPVLAILCAAIIVAAPGGCTAVGDRNKKMAMDEFAGHPLSDVAMRFGPPTTAFEMSGEQMTFQWDHFGAAPGAPPPASGLSECRLLVVAEPVIGTAPPNDLSQWIVKTWNYYGRGCV